MNRSPTSLGAYTLIKESGVLSRSRWDVYDCLFKHGPMTRNELDATLSRGGVNPTYSRRLVELERLGIAHRDGTKTCRITGFTCDAWDVSGEQPRAQIARTPSVRKIVRDLASMDPNQFTGDRCGLCGAFTGYGHQDWCVWQRAAAVPM
jgi:hypothetical protein